MRRTLLIVGLVGSLGVRLGGAGAVPVRVTIPEHCMKAWHAVAIRPDFDWRQVYGWLRQLSALDTITVEGCTISTTPPADVVVPVSLLSPHPEQLMALRDLPRASQLAAEAIWSTGCATVQLHDWPTVELCQTP